MMCEGESAEGLLGHVFLLEKMRCIRRDWLLLFEQSWMMLGCLGQWQPSYSQTWGAKCHTLSMAREIGKVFGVLMALLGQWLNPHCDRLALDLL